MQGLKIILDSSRTESKLLENTRIDKTDFTLDRIIRGKTLVYRLRLSLISTGFSNADRKHRDLLFAIVPQSESRRNRFDRFENWPERTEQTS